MSIYISPSGWRLKTANGIPYKLMEGYPKGSFEEQEARVEESYIIHSAHFWPFILESFPPTVGLIGPPPRRLPGSVAMFTRSISFEPLRSSLPADPFGQDGSAPAGTYDNFIKLNITYTSGKASDSERNEEDPITFLNVSADLSGSFHQAPMSGQSKWEKELGLFTKDEPVKEINLPVVVNQPQIEWTATLQRVDHSSFSSLLNKARGKLGKINQSVMPVLYNAYVNTVLFLGFSYSEEFSWRDGIVNGSGTATWKLLEIAIDQEGTPVTHNHVWNPEQGKFRVLLRPDGNKLYAETNLNTIFTP